MLSTRGGDRGGRERTRGRPDVRRPRSRGRALGRRRRPRARGRRRARRDRRRLAARRRSEPTSSSRSRRATSCSSARARCSPGQHVSLMGADGPGKAEIAAGELARTRIFCDDWEQASHGGELAARGRGGARVAGRRGAARGSARRRGRRQARRPRRSRRSTRRGSRSRISRLPRRCSPEATSSPTFSGCCSSGPSDRSAPRGTAPRTFRSTWGLRSRAEGLVRFGTNVPAPIDRKEQAG